MKPFVTVGIRNRTLTESFGLLSSYCEPILGSECSAELGLEVGEGIPVRTCYDINDRKNIRKTLEKELREGRYTQEFFDALDKTYKATVQDIYSFYTDDLSKRNNEEIAAYYDRFFQIYVTTLHPMMLAIFASDLDDLFQAELEEILKNEQPTKEQMIGYTALLLTPTRLTTVQKEEQMLMEIEREFEKTQPQGTHEQFIEFTRRGDIAARLEEVAKRYGWFHMEYLGEAKTPDDYRTQLWARIDDLRSAGTSSREDLSPEERLADIVRQQKAFFESHETSPFFKDLVFAMQEFLIVLDFTKADLIEGIYYARPVIAEAGKRVGLPSWIDVRYLFPQEITAHLREGTQSNADYIRDRKEHFTLALKDKTITPYFGEEAVTVANQLLERETVDPNTKEFKGMIAYPGVVRGTVCVITSADQRDKFKKGYILVTRETTTELTSIIKQSSAILADQAGMLSHTAIVAREFKIPCIVQTKIGTKLLKDGDHIEVDATQGVVRLLDHE